MTGDADAWAAAGASEFVLMTTYKRSGEAVGVPVWIAPDGDDLVMTSERSTGKVKRLRNDSRVRLQPCGRFGAITPGSQPVDGSGHVSGAHGADGAATRALAAKYGLIFRLLLPFEAFLRRVQRKPGDRVIVRISRTPSP